MNLNGFMAALAATGDALNAAENTIAQLQRDNANQAAQIAAMQAVSAPQEPQLPAPDVAAAGDLSATPAAP